MNINSIRRIILSLTIVTISMEVSAQADRSGIVAGFFDSSKEQTINFSEFKLPPLAVLFENAKQNPTILELAKVQEIQQAEVTKERKHLFSYVYGHASYSYGKTDMWGNGSSSYSPMIYQFQGSEQNYWNVGVNISVPLEDVLDLGQAVKRKRLLVEDAQLKKEMAYDELKLQIATLYVKITNNLSALKTASENAAIYQGAAELNEVEFHHGNIEIEEYAYTGLRGQTAVSTYQNLLTTITTDILTLEIISRTPIITNTTTEVTLDGTVEKTEKQIAKENKAVEKRIKERAEEAQRQKDAAAKQARKQQDKKEKQE